MMREIKFRAKCAQTGKWMYGYPVFYQDTCDFYVLEDVVLDKENNYVEHLPVRHFVVLETVSQYTGLKDKNGVEIYEGDIIAYQMTSQKLKCEVVFNDDKCCFGVRDEGYPTIYGINRNDIASRAEVIGNIYENPELLQEKQGDE